MGGSKYLNNMALTIMGQLGAKAVEMKAGETAHDLYNKNKFAINILLRKMRSETLGRIIYKAKPVMHGSRKTSIKDVDPWLDFTDSGMELLRDLAAATIVAEMTDIINERQRNIAARDMEKELYNAEADMNIGTEDRLEYKL